MESPNGLENPISIEDQQRARLKEIVDSFSSDEEVRIPEHIKNPLKTLGQVLEDQLRRESSSRREVKVRFTANGTSFRVNNRFHAVLNINENFFGDSSEESQQEIGERQQEQLVVVASEVHDFIEKRYHKKDSERRARGYLRELIEARLQRDQRVAFSMF